MIKDTNPDHYKVDDANFVEYMNDPKISGFGAWLFANGFNSGVWASGNWISVEDRLPDGKTNPLTLGFNEVICFCDFGGNPKRTDVRTYKFGTRIGDTRPHFWHEHQIMDGVVTHWQYLPAPQKEETK